MIRFLDSETDRRLEAHAKDLVKAGTVADSARETMLAGVRAAADRYVELQSGLRLAPAPPELVALSAAFQHGAELLSSMTAAGDWFTKDEFGCVESIIARGRFFGWRPPRHPKGRPEQQHIKALVWHLADVYEQVTGRRPARSYNAYDPAAKGPFRRFVADWLHAIDPAANVPSEGLIRNVLDMKRSGINSDAD